MSFYNILKYNGEDDWSRRGFTSKDPIGSFVLPSKCSNSKQCGTKQWNLCEISEAFYERNVASLEKNQWDFMNGPIREKLGIIPDDVIWGSQGGAVFRSQFGDFMRPAIDKGTVCILQHKGCSFR